MYHAPTNCYRSAGWHLLSEEFVPVPIPGQPDLVVKLTKWERKGETIFVVFWYRFGRLHRVRTLGPGEGSLGHARAGGLALDDQSAFADRHAVDGFAARTRILDMARIHSPMDQRLGCRQGTKGIGDRRQVNARDSENTLMTPTSHDEGYRRGRPERVTEPGEGKRPLPWQPAGTG